MNTVVLKHWWGCFFSVFQHLKTVLYFLINSNSNRILEHRGPLSSARNTLFLPWDSGDNLAEWNMQMAFYSGTRGLCHCSLTDDRADRTCLTQGHPESEAFSLPVFSGFLAPWLLGHAALMLCSRRKHSSSAQGVLALRAHRRVTHGNRWISPRNSPPERASWLKVARFSWGQPVASDLVHTAAVPPSTVGRFQEPSQPKGSPVGLLGTIFISAWHLTLCLWLILLPSPLTCITSVFLSDFSASNSVCGIQGFEDPQLKYWFLENLT